MRRIGGLLAALLVLMAGAARAQDVTGAWQGTLTEGTRSTRLLLQLAREHDGRLTAALYNLDQGGFGAPSVAFTTALDRGTLRASFARGAFEGKATSRAGAARGVAATMLTGTWTPLGGRGAAPAQPLTFTRSTAATAWRDSSAHRVRFVAVAPDVRLEVLDWGGPTAEPGRPAPAIVLLTGAGNNAHVFDDFAPKLAARYHVYGITRRGFGESSAPESGYLSDSLADDVLAVLDSLGIKHPILIGHSIAGQEMSSIATRHADRVAALVYLEAGYQFAFYDSGEVHVQLTLRDTQRKLAKLADPGVAMTIKDRGAMIDELLSVSLPLMERDLRSYRQALGKARDQSAVNPPPEMDASRRLVNLGTQKYTDIRVPVLAFFALPQETPPAFMRDSASRARADSISLANSGPHVAAFERGIPGARVVRVPHANHYVFRSNEAEVLREIRGFIAGLP